MEDRRRPPAGAGDHSAGSTPARGRRSGRWRALGPPPGPSDPRRSPDMGWSPWTAPAALIGGLVLAAVRRPDRGSARDAPVRREHHQQVTLPPGSSSPTRSCRTSRSCWRRCTARTSADASCAHGSSGCARPASAGARRQACSCSCWSPSWCSASSGRRCSTRAKRSCSNSSAPTKPTSLLLLSAALTCVVAPICEEFLFRGYIFTALRSWRGTWPAAVITGLVFGAVHAGSAPALDLVPLAGLGFGLCLLYRYSGSLYPCIAAHSLNNSLAFAALEGWGWQAPVLMIAALADDRRARAAGQAHRPDRPGGAAVGAQRIGSRQMLAPAAHPPAPVPVAGQIKLVLQHVGGSPLFALLGQRVVVRGVVTPYVGGQTVKVSFYRDGRKVQVKNVSVHGDRQRRGPVSRQLLKRLSRTRAGARRALRDRAAGRLQRALAGRAVRDPEPRARRAGSVRAPAAVRARRAALRGAAERCLRRRDRACADRAAQGDGSRARPLRGRAGVGPAAARRAASFTCATRRTAATSRRT